MKSNTNQRFFKSLRNDIPASIVVFLVALPLCLGIALASGAPLYAGLIGGVIGGIVVGSLSGSALGVSGPAAGLAVIILNAITELGSFEIFLLAVVMAGVLQLILGFVKAGVIAYYFPSSVIHGMLAGIGILIFIKQIPHAFGYDKDPEGDFEFIQIDGQNTFTELFNMLDYIHPGVVIVTFFSLAILILWETNSFKKFKLVKLFPGPLVIVILGILFSNQFSDSSLFAINAEHLVSIPVANSFISFFGNFSFPDIRALSNPAVYSTAIVIAIVASLETLLSVEAIDKLDSLKRITPTNRELKAQGVGNILSGLIGGLPVTQVIVRSSANQQSGGKTKASAILHGILLLISIIAMPKLLNQIPLGTLAAILLVIGYKLAKPSLFKKMFSQGFEQFFPFVITISGIIFTDLLKGIALGMVVAIFIILRNNFRIPYTMKRENLEGKEKIRIILSQDVSFLNKASIQVSLNQIPNDSFVEIDASENHFIHPDVIEIIEDFEISAIAKDIKVSIIDLYKEIQFDSPQHFEVVNNGNSTH